MNVSLMQHGFFICPYNLTCTFPTIIELQTYPFNNSGIFATILSPVIPTPIPLQTHTHVIRTSYARHTHIIRTSYAQAKFSVPSAV